LPGFPDGKHRENGYAPNRPPEAAHLESLTDRRRKIFPHAPHSPSQATRTMSFPFCLARPGSHPKTRFDCMAICGDTYSMDCRGRTADLDVLLIGPGGTARAPAGTCVRAGALTGNTRSIWTFVQCGQGCQRTRRSADRNVPGWLTGHLQILALDPLQTLASSSSNAISAADRDDRKSTVSHFVPPSTEKKRLKFSAAAV